MLTNFAHLLHVLSRFGASAEVLTDQGGEFEGELQALLDKCFIDHRITSAYHPQANGLAERQVQTFKRGLAKMCDAMGKHSNWDELIPWVAFGALSKHPPAFPHTICCLVCTQWYPQRLRRKWSSPYSTHQPPSSS